MMVLFLIILGSYHLWTLIKMILIMFDHFMGLFFIISLILVEALIEFLLFNESIHPFIGLLYYYQTLYLSFKITLIQIFLNYLCWFVLIQIFLNYFN